MISRLQKVLQLNSFDFDIVTSIEERCPGSFIDGLPIIKRGTEEECKAVSCKKCWEEVYSMGE